MTLNEILARLQSLKNDSTYKHNLKWGVGDNQYGVKLGDIKALAKKIKTNQQLALELWETNNYDAQLLATLILDPKELTNEILNHLVRSGIYAQVMDWLYAYNIKDYPDKETLRSTWMQTDNVMASRIGWSLTSGRVSRNPEGIDLEALLNRIETEMGSAPTEVQWTMNSTLAQIGIKFPEHRSRAIAIGEKLGVFRDYPTSKGCTSPFAPSWINEMVRRNEGSK